MRRMRTTVGVLVASVAVAVGPLGAVQNADAARADAVGDLTRTAFALMPGFAALRDSAALDTPVVLQGLVDQTAGSAMGGASVLLSAWPANETVRDMPLRATFTTTPIAWTIADAQGRYALRSALTPALASLVGRDGLDVQLDVFHGGRQYTYLSQVMPGGALGWLRPSLGSVADLASLSAAAPHNAVRTSFARGSGEVLAAKPSACPKGEDGCEDGPRPWPGGPPCLERKVAIRYPMTTVATALAGRGVTANVVYTYGAMSEMDAGISYNGGVSFGMGGKRTRVSTMEASFHPVTGGKRAVNREYQVEMEHTVIAHECQGNKPGQYFVRGYRTSPNGTAGGFEPIPSSIPAWKCARLVKARGGDVSAEQAQAFTYQHGFGFGFKGASFTGAATSGYSDTVKVTFVFPQAKEGQPPTKGWWCGHSGNPTDRGQRVQAFLR